MMSEAMTTAGRKSPAQWQRLMNEFEASDETQRAFCESRGIACSTFCYWRRRLRGAEQKPVSEPPLVELPLFVGEAQESGDFRVELDLGNGMVLRLR